MTIKFIKLFFALVLVYFILENKIIDFEAFSKIDFFLSIQILIIIIIIIIIMNYNLILFKMVV